VAVIALTLLIRTVLLPITWSIGYRAAIRQRQLAQLRPELERLKSTYKESPELLMQHTLALYRQRGLSFVDGRSLIGALVQMPLLLGMFQALRDGAGLAARFLWVTNLARPDVLLAVLAGLTTALMMNANPDLPDNMRALLVIVPAVIATLAAFQFASALALYFATTNCFSAAQTMGLRFVIARRLRLGTLKI
jgi:YidC/Oxa1 family membrane protein insertase